VGTRDDKKAARLARFRGVAEERLVRLNLAWIRYEENQDAAVLAEILRELHSLKGESALMGFGPASEVVHAVEDLLQAARAGRLDLQGASGEEVGDLLLDGLDLVSELIQRGSPNTPSPEADAFAARVRATPALAAGGQSKPPTKPQGSAPPKPPSPPRPAAPSRPVPAPGAGAQPTPPGAGAPPEPPRAGAPASGGRNEDAAVVVGGGGGAHSPTREAAVRVTSAKLDRMRDAVGELILARMRLAASASELQTARARANLLRGSIVGRGVEELGTIVDLLSAIETRLRADDFRMSQLIDELETTTRELRMVPIRSLFERYPRAVRSLARELGKKVRLRTEGEDIEADRVVLDRLAEPLLHLVRNAVDHGVEPADERRRAGKPEEGTITLRAEVRGRTLDVVVTDDGQGIDLDRVRARAVDLGLTRSSEARTMGDEDVLTFLFSAGMSTRSQVTNVSGRGIGLDVVMANIDAIGGTVGLQTRPGAGTTFRLSVPLSVAVSPVLLFRVGAGRYALPARTIEGVLDPRHYPEVEAPQGRAIHYEGKLVPLLDLRPYLGEEAPVEGHERLLIMSSGGGAVALAGTHDHSEREAVMKSVGTLFDHDPIVRSVVPLEDGSLALVLKTGELLAAATGATRRHERAERAGGKTVLVVDDSPVIRDLVAEALRSHGLHVVEAGDGQEALDRLSQGLKVELVVTDIEMPRLDGIGFIRALRALPGPRIPAVVVSMRGSDEDRRRAVDVGADAYLVKTDFSHRGLWALIARFLE